MALVGGHALRAVVAADGRVTLDRIDRAAPEGQVDVSEPGGRPLPTPAGAFAQVGRHANAALVRAVGTAIGDSPGRVLELHAGSGNFTRLLVQRSGQVIASEADPQALARGRANVPEADWRLPTNLPSDLTVDTVLVDPPREGLDGRGLTLAGSARGTLVYVSCDPQTLGRDVRLLAVQGWRLECAQALDLMPQTHHVEVVACFRRADRPK